MFKVSMVSQTRVIGKSIDICVCDVVLLFHHHQSNFRRNEHKTNGEFIIYEILGEIN